MNEHEDLAGGIDDSDAPADQPTPLERVAGAMGLPGSPGLDLPDTAVTPSNLEEVRPVAAAWLEHRFMLIQSPGLPVSRALIEWMREATPILGTAARRQGIAPGPLFQLATHIEFADAELLTAATPAVTELACLPDAIDSPSRGTPPADNPDIEPPTPTTPATLHAFDNPSRPVTMKEVACLLNMDPRTLRDSKEIRHLRVSGRRVVFDLDQIDAISPEAADDIKPTAKKH